MLFEVFCYIGSLDAVVPCEDFDCAASLIILHIPSNFAPSSIVIIAAFRFPVTCEDFPRITLDSISKLPLTVPLKEALLAQILPFTTDPFAETTSPFDSISPFTTP